MDGMQQLPLIIGGNTTPRHKRNLDGTSEHCQVKMNTPLSQANAQVRV